MQVTTGVDIIEVERIKKAIETGGQAFLMKVYTEQEVMYCNKSENMKYQHFAARFAAKEAVFKAISSYINGREDTMWTNIEVVNNQDGKPRINIERLKMGKLKALKSIDISISHIKDYAVASAVAMFEESE